MHGYKLFHFKIVRKYNKWKGVYNVKTFGTTRSYGVILTSVLIKLDRPTGRNDSKVLNLITITVKPTNVTQSILFMLLILK